MAAEASVKVRLGIFPRLLTVLLLVSLIPLLAGFGREMKVLLSNFPATLRAGWR